MQVKEGQYARDGYSNAELARISRRSGNGNRFQKTFFCINEFMAFVVCQFKFFPQYNRSCGTRFLAKSTKYASNHIDFVSHRISFPRRKSVFIRIFSRFNINALRRTRARAKRASNALFQSVFVPCKSVKPSGAWILFPALLRV